MPDLRAYGLVYLATPYTLHPRGPEVAFREAAVLAARLTLAGVKVFSPIVYTHPIATFGNIDPLDHAIWLPFDKPFMDCSEALVVGEMEGWQNSFGIAEETRIFAAAGKPIHYLNPETLAVR